jgi:hypothetical protein
MTGSNRSMTVSWFAVEHDRPVDAAGLVDVATLPEGCDAEWMRVRRHDPVEHQVRLEPPRIRVAQRVARQRLDDPDRVAVRKRDVAQVEPVRHREATVVHLVEGARR